MARDGGPRAITIMTSLKDSREACQGVNCAEWVWGTDDGRTALRCGAGHAGPRAPNAIESNSVALSTARNRGNVFAFLREPSATFSV